MVKVLREFKRFALPVFMGLLLSMISSMALIYAMRWIPGIITWTLICLSLGILLACKSNIRCSILNIERILSSQHLYSTFYNFNILLLVAIYGFVAYGGAKRDTTSVLIFAVSMTVAFLLFFYTTIASRKRIKFAIALIKESGRYVYYFRQIFNFLQTFIESLLLLSAVSSMWSTILFPIIPALFQIAVVGFFFVLTYCLWALKGSDDNYSHGLLNFLHVCHSCIYESATHLISLKNSFQAFNVIACLWDLVFISALSELSLAGTFATWYWAFDKADVPPHVITISATRSAYHHSGTAALGAVLVTICRMINLIVARFSATHCMKCIASFIEGFLKRFNRNAYIMCAIHGGGLFASGRSAYQLILRNVLGYLATDTFVGIVFAFCKVFIAFVTGVCSFVFFLTYFLMAEVFPFFVVICGAYFVAGAFFSVYSIAVDTLVLCARK